MLPISARRAVVSYVNGDAPGRYAEASAELRNIYAAQLATTFRRTERRRIARRYRKARSAMLLRIAAYIVEWE